MNLLKTRRKYQETIGEFISAFAEVELYVTIFDSIIQTENTTNPTLVGSFHLPFTIKLNHINDFIEKLNNNFLCEGWQFLRQEINDVYLNRNHIVHGTGTSSYWGENIRTILDEGIKKSKGIELSIKTFSVNDIHNMSQRTYHILTGEYGIQGVFLQEFRLISRSYFSKTT
jgi:hypothetical protein